MWKRILTICGVLYLSILLITLVWAHIQKREVIAKMAFAQHKAIAHKSEQINDVYQSLYSNAELFAKLPYPIDFETGTTDRSFLLPYLDFVQVLPNIVQLSFVDFHGTEFLKYQRNAEGVLVAAAPFTKPQRDYFKQGMSLEPGQIYISPIEPNRDMNQLTLPYTPVLRAETPILNNRKEQIGIVVLKYRLTHLFKRLKVTLSDDNFFLVDGDNTIITSNLSENDLAAKTFLGNNDSLLQKELEIPGFAPKKDTTFVDQGNLWVYQNIKMALESPGNPYAIKNRGKLLSNDPLAIVQEVPEAMIYARTAPITRNLLLFNGFSIFLLGLMAFGYYTSQQDQKKFSFQVASKSTALEQSQTEVRDYSKRMDEASGKLQAQYHQLKEFSHVVSDNLKDPASSMSLIVDMLLKEKDPEKIHGMLPKLEIISNNMMALAEDVQTYISILNKTGLKTSRVDLHQLMESLKNEYHSKLQSTEDHSFHILYKLDAWDDIKTSEVYLKDIFERFISNAIRFKRANTNSHIIFETGWKRRAKVIYVRDNGLGLDLKLHGDNMFKLYNRFHRNLSGKGTGLFMIKAQLEALNAQISVESQVGTGTIFTIKFNES